MYQQASSINRTLTSGDVQNCLGLFNVQTYILGISGWNHCSAVNTNHKYSTIIKYKVHNGSSYTQKTTENTSRTKYPICVGVMNLRLKYDYRYMCTARGEENNPNRTRYQILVISVRLKYVS